MAWLLVCIAGVYLVMSAVTFIAYGIDKRRAARGQWRIRESTLHMLELFFGWPGAAAAQIVFRHKRRKLGYMLIFAAVIALHIAAWAACVRLLWWH